MRIIFHHPLPLNYNATSASGIRPLKMIEAFKALGCEVALVTGYSAERKQKILKIKESINNGVEYDFVYSESSTMPTLLTDKNHLPLSPFVDFGFFSFCRRCDIPIGLFYRDIQWAFKEGSSNGSYFKELVARFFYKYDLYCYQKYLNKMYLPSLDMGNYIPIVDKSKFEELPPGHSKLLSNNINNQLCDKSEYNLFYVGGFGGLYKMHNLFEAVSNLPSYKLTVCTRQSEWEAVRHQYEDFLSDNINIIHESGKALRFFFDKSDILLLYLEPLKYGGFALPFKLFEYIGERKPILASRKTLWGHFVEKNNLGFVIDYDADALKAFLKCLPNFSDEYNDKVAALNSVAIEHTWLKRAEKVIKDLKGEL
ncbi:hypothetical protein [Pseudoalteromonas sp.]|uniref:hypothetical protein n=1 Tax=Pseudoalteromonas sp. TaxID=53249 RepID=UPI0026245BEA|nr:hypothetical protein [Pseudoalteromonas sp.]MCP4588760.1 glycosyltransferase family 4 protein [Pseudoalteromonas sp.]